MSCADQLIFASEQEYYEVIEIKIQEEKSRAQADGKSIHYEAKEKIPGNESFGGSAFCHLSRRRAEGSWNKLRTRLEARANKNEMAAWLLA